MADSIDANSTINDIVEAYSMSCQRDFRLIKEQVYYIRRRHDMSVIVNNSPYADKGVRDHKMGTWQQKCSTCIAII